MNTASRGETLVRGVRRVVGTVAGIAAGLVIAVPLHGAPVATAALIAVCVFGIFYTAAPSYSWMMFFVTVMAGLLYGLLGVLHPGLLGLRLVETGVGALGAALAVALVLPVTTHTVTDHWVRRALHAVHDCTAAATRRLAGDAASEPAARAAELDVLLGRVRLALLDECARQTRGLVAVAADPDASHDARLTAACHRVETAVDALLGAVPERAAGASRDGAPSHHPGAEQALGHLHDLERALVALATPLRGSSLAQA